MTTLERAFRAARLGAFAIAALSGGTAHAAITIGDQLDVSFLVPKAKSGAHDSGVLSVTEDGQSIFVQQGVGSVIDNLQSGFTWQDTANDAAVTVAGAIAAPESTTWALMITGFGLIGAAMRHQRQRITVRYA